ncbi:MAG: hypothetical protein Q8911_00510 [Bacillota bacterium]|nr:hypothetical protein [Bacillota bacterium]
MLEEQIQLNTADRQLLFDIRSESRKTNELLTQILEVLRPMRKDTELKKEVKHQVVKPKETTKEKIKRGKKNANN